MRNLKSILLKSPEYLLVLAVIFYWFSTSVLFNPIAIGLILLLIIQIIIKNKIIAFTIAALLIFSCSYLILALFSELNEFPVINNDALIMLFVGLIYLLFTMSISGILIYKYSNIAKSEKILTA